MTDEILSICAAEPGWWVEYQVGDGRYAYDRVTAWVVVRKAGSYVHAIDGFSPTFHVGPCGELGEFEGFVWCPDGEPTGHEPGAVRAVGV